MDLNHWRSQGSPESLIKATTLIRKLKIPGVHKLRALQGAGLGSPCPHSLTGGADKRTRVSARFLPLLSLPHEWMGQRGCCTALHSRTAVSLRGEKTVICKFSHTRQHNHQTAHLRASGWEDSECLHLHVPATAERGQNQSSFPRKAAPAASLHNYCHLVTQASNPESSLILPFTILPLKVHTILFFVIVAWHSIWQSAYF